LHGRPIEAIDRRAIATRLAEITAVHAPSASNRTRTSLSSFFTWAAREGYVEANPVAYTNVAVESGPRDRVLADDELAVIWRCLADDQFGAIVKQLMLTAARRDEIASLGWSEVDLEQATIVLPPARTKNRREHIIPLSDPALAILSAQPRWTGRELVFGKGEGGYQGWSRSKEELDARITAVRKGKALEWR